MRQVTSLKVEGKRIEATVTRLRELKEVIGKTTATFEEQVQHDLLLAKMQLAADEERVAFERKKIKDDSALADQYELKAKTEAQLKRNVDSSRINIAAKLSGIPAHTEKNMLDERLERATSAARAKLAELHAGLLAAAHIKNTGDSIVKRPVPEQFPKLGASVDVVAKALASTNVDRLAGLLNSVADANGDDVLSVVVSPSERNAFSRPSPHTSRYFSTPPAVALGVTTMGFLRPMTLMLSTISLKTRPFRSRGLITSI